MGDNMARVNGSKHGKTIIAKFNGQSKSLFPHLNQTRIVVLLSVVGNKFCAFDYLNAIVKTALSTFEFTTFLIADEVYWHNLRNSFLKDEEVALKQQAVQLGSNFFESNLTSFLSPLGITRDDFCLQHQNKSTHERCNILNELAKNSNFEVVFWSEWINKSTDFLKIKDN
jgi:hypothetical protein